MSTELPYFKFYVNEWITGDITLEDFEAQGLFINICAYYWFRKGDLTLTNAKKKFKYANPDLLKTLLDTGILKLKDQDTLVITFLDEQLVERDYTSKKNSENGKKGGAPKGNSNAKKPQSKTKNKPKTTQKQPNGYLESTENQSKTTNIEVEIEEEKNIYDVLDQPSSNVFFTINDFSSNISIGENEFTLLAVRKTKRSVTELAELLNAFITEQKGLSKLAWQSAADAKQHFINWANKQPTKDIPRYTPQIPN